MRIIGRNWTTAIIATICVLIGMAASPPTEAQTQQEIDWCYSSVDLPPDQRITGCTAVIQSARPGNDLQRAFASRCFAFMERQEDDRAIPDCDQTIRLNPNDARAHLNFYNRGIIFYRKKDYDRAIADYATAIALNPNFAIAYNARAVAYQYKGDRERAIADYRKAASLGHRDAPENLRNLGVTP